MLSTVIKKKKKKSLSAFPRTLQLLEVIKNINLTENMRWKSAQCNKRVEQRGGQWTLIDLPRGKRAQ